MKKLTPSYLRLVCSAAMLSLAGCGPLLSTTYTPPEISVPKQWANGDTKSTQQRNSWWHNFNDAKLNELVENVLKKNNDLAAATFKVRKAQLQADLAFDQFLPDIGATATHKNARNLTGHQTITRTYSTTSTISYEADLWGKIASQSSSADWEALATDQDRESTALSLVGTTIKLYWKIAYLNERIKLSQESIEYARKTLDLAKIKHEAGSVSSLDVAEGEQDLASQEASATQLRQQMTETLNALAILLDEPPGAAIVNPQALPQNSVPSFSAGLPSELLGRRPDLRAAEMRLREKLSDTDATRASYLPTITLTGSYGTSSIALVDILKNPIGTFGAGIALPFLNWFDMRKNVAISEVDYEQAIANFRQTLYQAFSDVENALSARTNDIEQGNKLEQSLKNAKAAEDIYELQYKEGYVDLQSWITAQEKRRTTEVSVLENRYTQITDAVTLYLALGGDTRIVKDDTTK